MSIRIQGLERTFRGRPIFRASNLEATGPGLVALTGANGSGKTTLLRILATLTAPTQGESWISGHSILSAPRRVRAAIGFVPVSDGGLFRRLSGRENLMLFGAMSGLSPRATRAAIDRWSEVLPLESALEARFAIASSGMRQALTLCRALLHDPEVLLLDEPTRGLDPDARASLWRALSALASEKTILFSSHDEAEWSASSDRWRIHEGKLRCSTSS